MNDGPLPAELAALPEMDLLAAIYAHTANVVDNLRLAVAMARRGDAERAGLFQGEAENSLATIQETLRLRVPANVLWR